MQRVRHAFPHHNSPKTDLSQTVHPAAHTRHCHQSMAQILVRTIKTGSVVVATAPLMEEVPAQRLARQARARHQSQRPVPRYHHQHKVVSHPVALPTQKPSRVITAPSSRKRITSSQRSYMRGTQFSAQTAQTARQRSLQTTITASPYHPPQPLRPQHRPHPHLPCHRPRRAASLAIARPTPRPSRAITAPSLHRRTISPLHSYTHGILFWDRMEQTVQRPSSQTITIA